MIIKLKSFLALLAKLLQLLNFLTCQMIKALPNPATPFEQSLLLFLPIWLSPSVLRSRLRCFLPPRGQTVADRTPKGGRDVCSPVSSRKENVFGACIHPSPPCLFPSLILRVCFCSSSSSFLFSITLPPMPRTQFSNGRCCDRNGLEGLCC